MIIPSNLPPVPAAAALAKERPQKAPVAQGRLEQSTLSDAREPLIKDKPAFLQLSNHNSDIGNHLTGRIAESPALAPESPAVASPLEGEDAAAASALSATQTILSQPAAALLVQANVSSSRAQRILS